MHQFTRNNGDLLAQRPEYTSRRNIDAGRHGWLRLTPAYSVQLVEELLAGQSKSAAILDPFSGTGTTALCAANRGNSSVSIDINPFLVWLGRAKTATYSKQSRLKVKELALNLQERMIRNTVPLAPAPPIHNLARWWAPEQLNYLQKLKGGIGAIDCTPSVRNLLKIAFCRTIIEVASVTRGHQSLSYAHHGQVGFFDSDFFWSALNSTLSSADANPKTKSRILLGDSRKLPNVLDTSVDVVITSPPYPNRVTTLRELRPYMYWLDFVQTSSEIGNLDWHAIGGTWGNATHRLRTWLPSDPTRIPKIVRSVSERIRRVDVESASILANFVLRYFEDIYVHLAEMKRVVRSGGRLHYVIGNSSFYGNLVEAEKAYVEIFKVLGFKSVRAEVLRKRSSGAELFEYVVSAMRP